MVLAAKIFQVKDEVSLDYIARKLRDYRKEEIFEHEAHKFTLLTEIRNLSLKVGMLKGEFIKDRVIFLRRRGEIVPVITTLETPFVFSDHKGRTMLIIFEKKFQANRIANELSKIIFIRTGEIVEVRIADDVLRRFHEMNPENTRLIWYDKVDIPGIEKLSLCGPALANTSLYMEYCNHGSIWYILMKSRKYGYVFGITRNGIIALFSKAEFDEFITFIHDEIFGLIS